MCMLLLFIDKIYTTIYLGIFRNFEHFDISVLKQLVDYQSFFLVYCLKSW